MSTPGNVWKGLTRVPALLCLLCLLQISFQTEGVTITIPHVVINATVDENATLSMDYSCKGSPTIQWKYMSDWYTTNITVWEPHMYENTTEAYQDRLNLYENGSIQILRVQISDAGFYVVTVTEDSGAGKEGIMVLKVHEKIFEDLHVVSIAVTFLVFISGFIMISMWLLNKCVEKHLKQKWSLTLQESSDIEVMELQPL
ncbi:V-set and transmembrane domain-containing protein 5-like [Polypterus senegalus]|uniref:V-set and transmembrane domain-containing protein 5-like n=1 Tax=Polypterus senegalus TaxID=55291 RepID=UPI0019667A9B|nr:V-set and transmembrane domain-containing protein 5-like [Polypterus senegalus]